MNVKFRFVSLLLVCATSATTARADIAWESDYATARAKSLATGKPLFIDVYTDWCGWCKRLDATAYADPRVQVAASRFVMLKLNAEGNGAAFARQMRVQGYPTLIFATARGEQVARRGYIEVEDFLAMMDATRRRNGWARPVRAVGPATPAKTRTRPAVRKTSSRVNMARQWKQQPEMRPVLNNAGYSGAFVLDERGAVPLDGLRAKSNRKGR